MKETFRQTEEYNEEFEFQKKKIFSELNSNQ